MAMNLEQLVEALVSDRMLQLGMGPGQNKTFENTEAMIAHDGTKIILPAEPTPMSYDEAIKWLQRQKASEEQTITIHEPVPVFPWDGAVAFMTAMKQIYGWANPVPTPTWWGDSPPDMLSIDVGPNQKATIFWGQFKVPGIEGVLSCNVDHNEGRPQFEISGSVKRKHLQAVHALAELTRKIAAENSIYRGKAVRLVLDDASDIDYTMPPKFMDLSRVNESELVFSEELMAQVQTNLFTPIEDTAACRKHSIPLKRGVLLEGPYGTGKTLCASVTAKKCEQHGWTFITVERVSALASTLQFAQVYQPCVVFVEDIDREMSGDDRDVEMDTILNTVDGIISKGTEIMVVLTSNHAQALNRAMLRPGRLDAVLHIGAPDAEAAEKLVRIYGRGLVEAGELPHTRQALAGQIPAVIRECVERAKLYAITTRGANFDKLMDEDLARAAAGMKHHLELLDGPKDEDPATPEHRLGAALGEVINTHLVNGHDTGFSAIFKQMDERVRKIQARVNKIGA